MMNFPYPLATDIDLAKLVDVLEQEVNRQQHLLVDTSYESGRLGLSLFWCYYALYSGKTEYYEKAKINFSNSINSFDLNNYKKIYRTDSIDNQLANIGKFLCFVKANNFFDADSDEYLLKLDSALGRLMTSKIAIRDFDYNSGATAAGYYFLSRLPFKPEVAAYLKQLVHGFSDQAYIDIDGDYFWRSPSIANNIYFGLSHGSAMVISIVANIFNAGIEKELCVEIISKACNFLVKHYRPHRYGHFPISTQDENMLDKPFCICYGDMGVAYALQKGNQIIQNSKVYALIDIVINESINRPRMSTYPPDASITYGAAGLYNFFQEMYESSGNSNFLNSANYWARVIPTYAIGSTEFAGFYSMTSKEADFWNASFGWGIIGIGISLMRCLNPTLPSLTPLLMIA